MNIERCPHEGELLDAFGRGFIGPELAAHVEECHSCREIHLVAGALLDERVQAITEAPVPSAATMRWRMQVRLRQEAETTARRSLLVGQALTLAVAMALIAWLFGADVRVGVREAIAWIRLSTPVLIALATWLLLAPIAGYVAITQK
jgi:predicted anti-sigma-YlaC factor YlaD